MQASIIPNVRRIAVLRANALGDFIVTLPAFAALRAAYPQAEITLLAKPWHRDFLSDRPSPIDRVIVIPVCNNIREETGVAEDPQELAAFFTQMQDERFDLAMHFQGSGRASNHFLAQLGARVTAGLRGPGAAPLDRAVPFQYYQSEVLRFLEVAALVGAPPVQLEPQLAVTESDLAEARRVLGALHQQPFAVIHAGANDIRRMWPTEKFAQVADRLAQQIPVVLTGSEAERDVIEQIRGQMQHDAHNLCGALTLGGLAGLLSLSALVVSSDTGPLHLARAVGAKTVGIYWFPNLINWGPLTRTRHRPVISWQQACPQCGIFPNQPYPFEPKTPECEHLFSFVSEAPVEEVYEQALNLLDSA